MLVSVKMNTCFTRETENHLDRQSVVGFLPEGSYSSPFGLKPLFWGVSGRFSEKGKKSFKKFAKHFRGLENNSGQISFPIKVFPEIGFWVRLAFFAAGTLENEPLVLNPPNL